ncbi:MAG: Xaa-His dipeptidase, partial [Clostridia bacterium]|nr:Xaa-His dipeptidase [Clostridia bacterium]
DFIKTLLKTYEHVTGKKGRCIAIGGGTYVHETEGGVAFGAEFIGDDNRMHGANERMSLDLFKMNAKMYAEAIINLCK